MAPRGSELFCDICQELVDADVPEQKPEAMRLSHLTALRKPNFEVRGMVVGDIVRISRPELSRASGCRSGACHSAVPIRPEQ